MNFDATLIYWHRLNKLYDLLREELLKKFGITQIESEILVYLAFHEAFGEAGAIPPAISRRAAFYPNPMSPKAYIRS